MPIKIAPYSDNEIAAVKAFNERLRLGGAPRDYVFSESPVPKWLPHFPGAPVYNEFYLALENGAVRGAYVVKHQKFSFRGEIRPVVYLHHPFSEGIVDKKYAQVGAQMLMHITRAYPVLFALGMGGYDRPLPRMLMAFDWKHCLIPFYFRVCHPVRFLENLQILRQTKAKRLMAALAVASGTGWLGIKIFHAIKGRNGMRAACDAEIAREFDDWAEEVWRASAPDFAMIAVRDACALRTLYPASNPNFIRLKITARGRLVGWSVAAQTQQRSHPQYGNLRVGTILDCLSRPEDATLLIAAATRALTERGADVIVSNQSHARWQHALDNCGFLEGPSNFIFAVSKKLSEALAPFEKTVPHIHLNRGDGDNLLQYL